MPKSRVKHRGALRVSLITTGKPVLYNVDSQRQRDIAARAMKRMGVRTAAVYESMLGEIWNATGEIFTTDGEIL